VLQEAASLSVPLMLLSGSSIADQIQHGVNGFLCTNNALDWASVITSLTKNNELLVSVGNNGRRDLVKIWPTIVKKVELQYQHYISE
jgi:SNF family Na+-dependent transporter